MSESPLPDDLAELLSAICEGSATEQQIDQLEQLALADDAVCRTYLSYMALHGSLGKLAPAEQRMGEWANATIAPPSVHPVAPSPSPSFARSLRSPVVWSILAASLLFAAYFVGISWDMLGKQLASSHRPTVRSSDRVEAVATIRETNDVEWSSESQSPLAPDQGRGAGGEGSAIAQNQHLSIQSGLIELQLKQGTTLLIEGPADWEITGSNSAKLTRGKLVAKVPQQAIGFTLETPTARIVDLGTEFGVEVGSGGVPEVHVLKGLVDVQALGRGKTSSLVRLQAGESVRIRGDGSRSPVERSDAKKFMRLADRKTPVAREHSASTRLIDLSKGADASQSSLYSPAANAIDGNLNTFSHTSLAGDRTPWWQVDLGRMRAIASVVVVNRLVTGKSRLRNITIKLLADDGVTEVATSPLLNPGNKDWGGVRDDRFGPTQLSHDFRTRAGEPLAARFVRIERTPEEEDRDDSDQGNPVLTIGEVQIFENADPQSVQK